MVQHSNITLWRHNMIIQIKTDGLWFIHYVDLKDAYGYPY